MDSVIFRDVAFSYPQHAVFQHLDIEIPAGTVSAIVGENGTGKSTFAKLINGLLKPQSGQVIVDDHSTTDLQASEMAKYVGYVFQNPDDQIFHSTVEKEIAYGYHQVSQLTVKEALKLTGLADVGNSNPFDLSLAQRKFIAIASVLVMDTDVVIMDEPTSGQDREGMNRLIKIIDWLKQRRKTVLIITHDMNFVAEHLDRAIALGQGKVQFHGSVNDLFHDDSVIKQCGLMYPDIMIIAQRLGLTPTPLTIKELAKRFSE